MPIQVGDYTCQTLITGYLRLDGGAMFGSVPKALWATRIPPDEHNRIRLAARVLLCRSAERVVLIDTGCGEKYTDKERSIYGVEPAPGGWSALLGNVGLTVEDITDVIITHLHFDHAGGTTSVGEGDDAQPRLTFPHAVYHVQKENLDTALNPNPRERASYLAPNIQPLVTAQALRIHEGPGEILPGIHVDISNGHTRGMQIVTVEDPARPLTFGADLIPTASHLPVPFTMGYDLHAEWIMAEKAPVLDRLVERGGILVFEHDPEVVACTLRHGGKYHEVAETLAF